VAGRGHWIRPSLVAALKLAAWTSTVNFATIYLGLCSDKKVRGVIRERDRAGK
jgi:hypothetical protein